jgi:precorrin-2 dehydrogenase / sirohydrochlorin ferrochelatase
VKYFPVFLNLEGRLCVVTGGGRVAERKVRSLLNAGARVKVISPKLSSRLSGLEKKGKIEYQARPFRAADLRGAFLAIAATDDRSVNGLVFQQGVKQKIPVNVVDDPGQSSFIVPSLIRRGDLSLAISTSGRAPALARALRRRLQVEIGPEYELWLKILTAARKKILPLRLGQKKNQAIFRKLAGDEFLALIRQKDWARLDSRFKDVIGPGFTMPAVPGSRARRK